MNPDDYKVVSRDWLKDIEKMGLDDLRLRFAQVNEYSEHLTQQMCEVVIHLCELHRAHLQEQVDRIRQLKAQLPNDEDMVDSELEKICNDLSNHFSRFGEAMRKHSSKRQRE